VTADPYAFLAPWFEAIEAGYSGGAIRAAKHCFLGVQADRDVIYLGSGTASEAVVAARSGARVTLLEPSTAMGQGALRRFRRAGLPMPDWQQCPLSRAEGRFDVAVAHFFLNLFTREALDAALGKIQSLLRAEGHLIIADFSPWLSDGRLLRWYWYLPLHISSKFTGDPVHPLFDFRVSAQSAAFDLLEERAFRIFGFGPSWFRASLLRKIAPIIPLRPGSR